MPRVLWIVLIATALLALAAVGFVARLVSRPSPHEPSRRHARRGRLVRAREVGAR
jgi:hypothetical protein